MAGLSPEHSGSRPVVATSETVGAGKSGFITTMCNSEMVADGRLFGAIDRFGLVEGLPGGIDQYD